MGIVKDRISKVTDNKTAIAIGEAVDNGAQLHDIIEKYGKTPELKAEIKEISLQVEAALRKGKSLQTVLDYHFDNEEIKGHVHKHVAHVNAATSAKSGNVKNRIAQVTDNETALKIGEDVDNGADLHDIIEKYGTTPEMKAEIKEIAAQVEAALRKGKSIQTVLDYHFDHDEIKGHIHKQIGLVNAARNATGNVTKRVAQMTNNKTALAIAKDVDNGADLHDILEKYGTTPEMKAEIKEIAAQVEAALRKGKSIQTVLDYHFDNDTIKGHVTKHAARVNNLRKPGSVSSRISKITNNKNALAIAEDIDNGANLHEIIEKYGPTAEIRAEIKEVAAQVEAALKKGKSLQTVLDYHFEDDDVKEIIHKNVAHVKNTRKQGKVRSRVAKVTDNKTALAIAEDVDAGAGVQEMIEKYATSPEMEAEIKAISAQVEAALRKGKSLQTVLDYHFDDEEIKGHIHKHVNWVNNITKKGSVTKRISQITDNENALNIAEEIDNGATLHDIIEKYGTTPAIKEEIKDIAEQIEEALREGKSLKEVLDYHFDDESVKSTVHTHVNIVNADRKKGNVKNRIAQITDNATALAIGEAVDHGADLDDIISKYGTTPELKAEIKEISVKVEAALRQGKSLKDVLDYHFDNEDIKGHVHKHVAHVNKARK